MAMTWHLLSSVSKARFVAAGATSMKLGVRIPSFTFGQYAQSFFDFRGHLENQTFAI
jgi:hypothetical protein